MKAASAARISAGQPISDPRVWPGASRSATHTSATARTAPTIRASNGMGSAWIREERADDEGDQQPQCGLARDVDGDGDGRAARRGDRDRDEQRVHPRLRRAGRAGARGGRHGRGCRAGGRVGRRLEDPEGVEREVPQERPADDVTPARSARTPGSPRTEVRWSPSTNRSPAGTVHAAWSPVCSVDGGSPSA